MATHTKRILSQAETAMNLQPRTQILPPEEIERRARLGLSRDLSGTPKDSRIIGDMFNGVFPENATQDDIDWFNEVNQILEDSC
ncbi:MAG: hypothetical protein Q8O38_16635 [Sulfurimicrobium sp.]|nr:hypothetical protein [Sulfurimicrobium sp.]